MTTPTPDREHYAAKISAAISTLIVLSGIGTVGFHHFEHWNWTQSLYFTVSTLTTVGYGDLAPTNDASRLFATIFIMFGVAAAITALGVIGAAYLDRRTSRLLNQRPDKQS